MVYQLGKVPRRYFGVENHMQVAEQSVFRHSFRQKQTPSKQCCFIVVQTCQVNESAKNWNNIR